LWGKKWDRAQRYSKRREVKSCASEKPYSTFCTEKYWERNNGANGSRKKKFSEAFLWYSRRCRGVIRGKCIPASPL